MAARRKALEIPALEDSAAYTRAIEASDKMLIVIDVHQSWCGPCTVMESTFRRIFIDQDRCDERLKVYTMDASKLTEDQRKALPKGSMSSKPLFMVFKSRVPVAKVQGANSPDLEAAILDNIPPLGADE